MDQKKLSRFLEFFFDFDFIRDFDTNRHALQLSRFKVQGSLLFVTYTIIQGIISSEM